MSRIADAAIIAAVGQLMQGQARDRGDAVIALLAMDGDVLVTECPQRIKWEEVVCHLGFLQAENVGRPGFEEMLDQRHAQSHRVDVPGCDRQCHVREAF